MKIGILGSGDVGVALAKGFLSEGHQVWLATREPDGEKGEQLKNDVADAEICDFSSAAEAADIAVFCVHWEGAEAAIKATDPANLAGKIVIDTSNVMKMEDGAMVYGGGSTSAAEQLQTWLPDSNVVKAFNSVGAVTMYKPDFGDQMPTMFIAGNDADAKTQATTIVEMFGWEALDCGDLRAARSLEHLPVIWVNYVMATKNPQHAYKML